MHELHVFCDASEKAYGAVVYARETFGNFVTVNFLTSKASVAPLKHTTIPKLELCAASTGMKLIQAVLYALRSMTIKPTVYAWSDSTTVLHWLDNLPGKWQTFVAVSAFSCVFASTERFELHGKYGSLVSRGGHVRRV